MDLGISGKSCLKFLSNKNNIKIFDDNLSFKISKIKKYF